MNSKRFENWWNDIGSGITPVPGEDQEAHCKRVSELAFSTGNALAFDDLAKEAPGEVSPASIQKAASVWCQPDTSGIAVDTRLALTFARIIEDIWSKPWLGNATNRQLLDELAARIDLNYRTVDAGKLPPPDPTTICER